MSEDALAVKLAVLRPHRDERQWRLLLGAEAVAVVARPAPTGMSEPALGRH